MRIRRHHTIDFKGVLLILLALGMWAAGASLLRPMWKIRKAYDLELQNPLEEQSLAGEIRLPMVSLFMFRSLAIDYLWIRADRLQEQGQYFDSLYLSRLICTLQPNIASVWDFQAWDMAYNISVALPTPQERWNWVRAGYELIRDKGLKYNPESLRLHHSLSWLFRHKIGNISDDFHRFYKLQLAMEITPLLLPLYGNELNSAEDIEAMAALPETWTAVQADAAVAELAQKIRAAEPSFTNDQEMFEGLIRFRLDATGFSPDFRQVLEDYRYEQSLKKLDRFARAWGLRRIWKMQPKRMAEINKKYGPFDLESVDQEKRLSLDWRLPWSHSLYWSVKGLDYADKAKKRVDVRHLDRDVYLSLQDLFHYGNLQILQVPARWDQQQLQQGREIYERPQDMQLTLFNSQDLRMFPVAYKASLEDVIQRRELKEEDSSAGGFFAGSTNLCMDGIVNLYLAGYRRMAEKYLQHLRDEYPQNKDYQVLLDRFVQQRMREEVKSLSSRDAADYIINLLRSSYYQYARGDFENATIRNEWARMIHSEFLKEFPSTEDPTQRLSLRSFNEMYWVALMDFLRDQRVGPETKGMLMARFKNEKPDLYDRIIKELQKERTEVPGKG